MLGIVLLMGPLSYFYKPLQKQIVWRRTLGIWSAIYALLHTIVILDGWVEWNLERLFFIFTPPGQPWILHPGFALANMIGILALIYYLMLTVTSNDWSIKLLGKKSWKYLQQKTTVLYTLVILHTLYFLFFHEPENPNWFKGPFIVMIVFIFILRVSAFLKAVKRKSLKKAD
ncbi:ferric reductase-like transmembrane domain-containing protein [Sutcliffiella horikoshii]|uniref:ferric reductase-like transmembrane domain-containing protein n=1 Tax=Sutcliffiella horikoshii TaxID=79883 RepID=UPI00384BFE2C